jgi:hypothetical protein
MSFHRVSSAFTTSARVTTDVIPQDPAYEAKVRRPLVKTVADPRVVDGLVRRLARLMPGTPRRWGTLSAHEMLCHLADASASVLARPGGGDVPARRVRKLLALYTSIPWPHGLRTPPHVDQRIGGTPPAVFALDRDRAIARGCVHWDRRRRTPSRRPTDTSAP